MDSSHGLERFKDVRFHFPRDSNDSVMYIYMLERKDGNCDQEISGTDVRWKLEKFSVMNLKIHSDNLSIKWLKQKPDNYDWRQSGGRSKYNTTMNNINQPAIGSHQLVTCYFSAATWRGSQISLILFIVGKDFIAVLHSVLKWLCS